MVDDGVNFFFGADVHAAGGLIQNQDVGLSAQPFGQNDFLLVAARQAFYGQMGIGGAYRQLVYEFLDKLVFAGGLGNAHATGFVKIGQHDVVLNRKIQ